MKREFCDICGKPAMGRIWNMKYYVSDLSEDGTEVHIHRRSVALCKKCAERVDRAVLLWKTRHRVFTKAQLEVIENAIKEKSNEADRRQLLFT